MNLEPIIQREVSQKQKDKYCMLMHVYIESRKKVQRIYLQGNNGPSLAQTVKHLPAIQENCVPSLGQEGTLK